MDSGVYMGRPLNDSYDLLPPEPMYEACRLISRHVRRCGELEWDFTPLHQMPIDPAFTRLIEAYLADVLASDAERRGWKIPETVLCLPWIVRMFPQARYIFWVRNPRDSILGGHVTDDLTKFGLDFPLTDDERLRRAASWKYQYDVVKATSPPANRITVRMEDFVLDQDATLARLGRFCGLRMAKIPVKPEAVGRYRADDDGNYFDFLRPAMEEYGYEIPDATAPAREDRPC